MIANLLASGLSDYFSVFEYYFGKFGSNTMEPIIWIEFSLALLIGFAIRGYFLIQFELGRIDKDDKVSRKKISIYCAGHIIYEFLIGYIVCYCLVNFANANPKAFIVNTLVCPGAAFLAGYIIDIKIIMKLEKSGPVANIDKEIEERESHKPSNTVIEIPQEEEDDNDDKIKKINLNNIQTCDAQLAFKIISTLNEVIDKSNNNNIAITDVSSKIEILEKALYILKETERKDKMLEVKSLIYKCLNKHFATPEENDMVIAKYNAYRLLVENDLEMEALYNKYSQLSVHEDRRKKDVPVENDRRKPRTEEYKITSKDIQ